MGANSGTTDTPADRSRQGARSTSPPQRHYGSTANGQQTIGAESTNNNRNDAHAPAAAIVRSQHNASVVDSGYGSLDKLKVVADSAAAAAGAQLPYQRSASKAHYYSPVAIRRTLTGRSLMTAAATAVPTMKDTAYDRVVVNLNNK